MLTNSLGAWMLPPPGPKTMVGTLVLTAMRLLSPTLLEVILHLSLYLPDGNLSMNLSMNSSLSKRYGLYSTSGDGE